MLAALRCPSGREVLHRLPFTFPTPSLPSGNMGCRNKLLNSRFRAFAAKQHLELFKEFLTSQLAPSHTTQHIRTPATAVNAPVCHHPASPPTTKPFHTSSAVVNAPVRHQPASLPAAPCSRSRSRSPMIHHSQVYASPAVSTSRTPASAATPTPTPTRTTPF